MPNCEVIDARSIIDVDGCIDARSSTQADCSSFSYCAGGFPTRFSIADSSSADDGAARTAMITPHVVNDDAMAGLEWGWAYLSPCASPSSLE